MSLGIKQIIKISLQHFFSSCARDVDLAAEPGPVLVIAPHPDDESLGCGAAIARLRANGQKVRIVIVSDGAAAGSGRVPSKELAAARRAEALNAGQALGVPGEDMVFLDFPDGHTEQHAVAIADAIGAQVRALAPRRVFSPYGTDGHPDHRAIAAVVGGLYHTGVIACAVYEYPIWFWSYRALGHLLWPTRLATLRRIAVGDYLANKKAALAAHRSQFEAVSDGTGRFAFPEGFVAFFLTPFELFFEKSRK